MKLTMLAALPAVASAGKMLKIQGETVQGEYAVVLKEGADLSMALSNTLSAKGMDKVQHLWGAKGGNFKGFGVADCSDELIAKIAAMPEVDFVEPSQVYYASAVQNNPTWGLDRIDQTGATLDSRYYYKDSAGKGVDSYVLDTGVRVTHNDVNGRAEWGVSYVGETTDGNGHGSHVAGTMGGTTYGVAKETKLISVQVLSRFGSGSTNGVVSGIEYSNNANSDRTKVANMSLGGGASAALDNAVNNAVDTLHVVASGNSNADACNFSPARADNAYSVNSMQQGDSRSSFSNYGTCTDIFAPGSSITSIWYTSDSATNTISGTSMAAPHVAGVAALLLSESPSLTVAQTKAALTNSATVGAISNIGNGSPNLMLYNDRD